MIKCKYCKEPLEDELEITSECHSFCQAEIDNYNNDQTPLSKRFFFLTQLKEHIETYRLLYGYPYYISYYFQQSQFKDYYDYLVAHRFFSDNSILENCGILLQGSSNDQAYLDGTKLIIEYTTPTLELPDFFERIPSLKLIIIYLKVKNDVDIKNTIPKSLRSKCIINLLITEDFDVNKLNDIPWNDLVLDPNRDFIRNSKINVSSSIIDDFEIEEALLEGRSSFSLAKYQIDDINYNKIIYGKEITFINRIINSLPTDKVKHITSDVDLYDYTKFRNLKYLFLNDIFKIDPIFNLKKLVCLEIKNSWKTIFISDDAFQGFTSLKYLKLAGFKNQQIPSSIRLLKNLQVLVLTEFDLKEIPVWLGELHMLEILSLRGYYFSTFPFQILDELQHLQYLDLRGNRLSTEQLEMFSRFTHLKVDY